MKRIIVAALVLVLIPVFINAADAESNFYATKFSIAGAHNSHILAGTDLFQQMPLGRHILDSLYYCSLAMYSAIGLTAGGTYEGAIRLTPTELGPYTGWKIIAIDFRHYEATLNNVVKVYGNGTASSPGALITSQPYTSSTPGWKWIALSSPVTIPGSGDLWCSVEVTHAAGEYPLAVDAGPAVDGKGDWMGPSWAEMQAQGLDYNWQILAIVQLFLDNDVQAVSIDMPSVLPPDTIFNPQATVKNVGLVTNTFNATCKIEPDGYSSVATVTNLLPEESRQITFPSQFNSPLGIHTVTVYTQLATDGNRANDTIVKAVEVYWADVLPVSIDIPDEVPTDTTFKPQATITNIGTYPEGFLVSCRIEPGGYYKNFSVSNLAPNESLQITFNQNFTFLSGVYTVTVYTRLSDDDDLSNDTLEKVIDAAGIAEGKSDAPVTLILNLPTICRRDVEIEFILPKTTDVDLLLYDASGRLLRVLVRDIIAAGSYHVTARFDLPAGVYFCHLKTKSGSIIRKFLIVE